MPTVVSVTDKVQRQLWTADDFLDWLEPGIHADLIDGEKFMHSPVNFKHSRLLNFVHLLLGMYVEARQRSIQVHCNRYAHGREVSSGPGRVSGRKMPRICSRGEDAPTLGELKLRRARADVARRAGTQMMDVFGWRTGNFGGIGHHA